MNIDLRAKRPSREGRYVLLFGGSGCEREISLLGAERFLAEAERINFDFLPIFISKSGDFFIFSGRAEDISRLSGRADKSLLTPTSPVRLSGVSGFLDDGDIIPVKLVFPLLHGDFGEDGVIQGLLSALGMKFFGADNFIGAVAADKFYAKLLARSVGVPTLPEIVLRQKRDASSLTRKIKESFGFPVFVKPVRLGSSIGASLAEGERELPRALRRAFSVAEHVMIEPAVLEKRELEVAYYGVGGRKIITPPAEISADGGFYDFDLKYKSRGGVSLSAVADVDEKTRELVRLYAERIAEVFSLRHAARIDYFLLPDGRLYFNEINTMPGMTAASLYSEMLRRAGVTQKDFILSLCEIAD